MDFKFQEMFPLGKDKTEYHLLTKDYVSVANFDGEEVLKVDPQGIRLLARQALHDVSFMLRPEHNEQVASILSDPEASVNDRAVALTMLLNADVASKGVLPFCQDTGTATVVARKARKYGQAVVTRRQFLTGYLIPIHRTISDIPRMHLSICITRKTPAVTFLHR